MPILVNIYFLLLFLNCLTGLYYFKSFKTIYKFFVCFGFYTLVNELICWNDPTPHKQLTAYLYNLYFFISLVFWTYFFYRNFISTNVKKICLLIGALAIAMTIVVYLFNGVQKIQNSISVTLALHTLLMSILFFIDIILKPSHNTLASEVMFWISCALAVWGVIYLFYSGPLYYFVKKSPDLNKITYICLNIVNLITYSLIQIGLMSKSCRTK